MPINRTQIPRATSSFPDIVQLILYKWLHFFQSGMSCTICFGLILTCVLVTVNSQNGDVGGFLSKLMREYVPKNTRHYTLYNGLPVYSGPEPQADSDISRTLLSPSSNPFINSLVPDGPGPFMNYGPWKPTPTETPGHSPSFLSSFFGRSVDNGKPEAQEKSEIITLEDLPQRESESEVREIKIQSSMSFTK